MIILLLLQVGTTVAQEPPVEGSLPAADPFFRRWGPRLTFWRPRIQGSIAPDEVRGAEYEGEGTRVSFNDDVGLDSGESVPFLELELFGRGKKLFEPKEHGLFDSRSAKLTFWRHSWDGSTMLQSDLWIDGELFPKGTPAEHSLTLTYFGLDMSAAGPPDFPIQFELTWGCRYVRVDCDLESPVGNLHDAEGGLGMTFGMGASISPVPWVHAGARVAAGVFMLGIPVREASVFFGVEAGPLCIEAGYRGLWSDMNSESQFMDLSLDGPFLALEIRF